MPGCEVHRSGCLVTLRNPLPLLGERVVECAHDLVQRIFLIGRVQALTQGRGLQASWPGNGTCDLRRYFWPPSRGVLRLFNALTMRPQKWGHEEEARQQHGANCHALTIT